MIASWMVYCVIVATLFGVAALALDAILTALQRPARWVWLAALAASIAVPVAMRIRQQRPQPIPAVALKTYSYFAEPDAASPPARVGDVPKAAIPFVRARAPESVQVNGIAAFLLGACILFAALRIALDSAMLFRGRRAWAESDVDGSRVLVSEDFGPAIVGLLTPRIVLPRWTLALEAGARALMLAHEEEHLRAHDSQLTTITLLSVLCMPWNPAIWWTLRRLRVAIEVDCDRRVLAARPDVARYGRLLVEVAQRATGTSLAVAGFSERASPLAHRIRAMTAERGRTPVLRIVAASTAGMIAIVSSAMVLPPAPPLRSVPEYSTRMLVLPHGVGDSIAEIRTPDVAPSLGSAGSTFTPVIVGGARDLPRAFTVADYGPSSLEPAEARCAGTLRDDRDGTILRVHLSRTTVLDVMQHADTVWSTRGTVGYYFVVPSGRYEVADGQYLRVGCGTFTTITVAGEDVRRYGITDLESPDNERPRRLAAAVDSALHVMPDHVELRPGRLNISIVQPIDTARAQRQWDEARQIFAIARRLLDAAAVPETLAFTVREKGRAITLYRYKEQP
jgi:hypothetical protein